MAPKEGVAPIYNATYTLFRLSPLYVQGVDTFWTEETLKEHARRFGNSIQNDNLRTATSIVEEEDAINRAGPFKQCRWSRLRQAGTNEDAKSADDLGILEGLQVEVEYEKASYMALLLRGVESSGDDSEGEIKLPLVCIRMPAALRGSFTHYLATVFDTRMEPLQLSSTAICKSLESFLNECYEDEDSFERIVKEIQLTLAFSKPVSAMLRTIDVAIRRDDVPGFLKQGRALSTSSVHQVKSVDGVFMAALQQYLQAHIALDISAEQVMISRVACGMFALGREGKLKLFNPASSTDDDGDYDSAAMASRRATAEVLQVLLACAIGNT